MLNAFTSSKNNIEKLNISYGNYLGEVVNNFKEKHKISAIDLLHPMDILFFTNQMMVLPYKLEKGNLFAIQQV